MTEFRYIAVIGPTGSGKSFLATQLAERFSGELINCDSVQVYKGFDIGSNKEIPAKIPLHLVDIVTPDADFDAAKFAELARLQIADSLRRKKLPVVVGGTGLYLRALWGENFDIGPAKDASFRARVSRRENADLYAELQAKDANRAAQLHPNDKVRIVRALEIIELTGSSVTPAKIGSSKRGEAFVIKVDPDRSVLHQKIAVRAKHMLEYGLVEEVKNLLAGGVDPNSKPMQAIGYKQVVDFLSGQLSKAELEDRIVFATRQYAKRQCTWFKKVNEDLRVENPADIERFFDKISECLRLNA